MQKLLLFDIDGTLIRMKKGIGRKVVEAVLDDLFNVQVPADYKTDFGGKTDILIFLELAKDFGISDDVVHRHTLDIMTSLRLHFEQYSNTEFVRLLHGATEIVGQAAERDDVTLALLTGNIEPIAYKKLAPYNLDSFFDFGAFGSDNHARPKLPPIAVQRANTLHGSAAFSSENTLIIGDTLRDIDCARANSMKVCAVATGGQTSDKLATGNPDYLFEDFTDTKKLAEVLFSFTD